MKSDFYIVDNDTWHPSSYYDDKTSLIWVMNYILFKRVFFNNNHNKNVKYAIHKDVYNAFIYKYNNRRKNRTRKRKQN